MAIDIYNNYITNAHDNSIEMDGSMHNIRIMRNMLINSASHPMSTQPSVGGPIYFIRNIVYHAPGGSTRMTAGSPGVLFYNNTVTTETSAGSSANAHWRNNLMLGQNARRRSSASTPTPATARRTTTASGRTRATSRSSGTRRRRASTRSRPTARHRSCEPRASRRSTPTAGDQAGPAQRAGRLRRLHEGAASWTRRIWRRCSGSTRRKISTSA